MQSMRTRRRFGGGGSPIGDLAVGSIVKLNVNGAPKEFIVVNQGIPSASSLYDASCDGTWLLMKDVYDNAKWGYPPTTDTQDLPGFQNGDAHRRLNYEILNAFDDDIRSIIKWAKIPFCCDRTNSGSIASGADGLSGKLFLLSFLEVGMTNSSLALTDGACLEYFSGAANSKRIAYLNGAANDWFTRSWPKDYTCALFFVSTAGGSSTTANANQKSHGYRPALVLPSDLMVGNNGEVVKSSIAGLPVQSECAISIVWNSGSTVTFAIDAKVTTTLWGKPAIDWGIGKTIYQSGNYTLMPGTVLFILGDVTLNGATLPKESLGHVQYTVTKNATITVNGGTVTIVEE